MAVSNPELKRDINNRANDVIKRMQDLVHGDSESDPPDGGLWGHVESEIAKAIAKSEQIRDFLMKTNAKADPQFDRILELAERSKWTPAWVVAALAAGFVAGALIF